MKKYKLINTTTKEEHLCDKVTIDGFDYYVNDETPEHDNYITYKNQLFIIKNGDNELFHLSKKVIATNNPNIDIPQILEEPNETLIHQIAADLGYRMLPDDLEEGIKAGYKESQETHPFSEDDMVEFAEWIVRMDWNELSILYEKSTKELFQLWKEQQTKKVYYESN